MADCPVHCVNIACSQPHFIQENESFILTLIGIFGGGLGVLLSYFLKSRCTRIKLGCIRCEREPIVVTEIDNVNNI